MCEHLGISALNGKRVKVDNGSVIKEHLFCNHSSEFDDFVYAIQQQQWL